MRVGRKNGPKRSQFFGGIVVGRGFLRWAWTLGCHAADKREYVCSLAEFETAGTDDPYWNAA